MKLTQKELAREIRARVSDLNDLVILAALDDLDVDFDVRVLKNVPRTKTLIVYVSQEV